MSLARDTPLLLLFFSPPAELLASLLLRSVGFEALFSDRLARVGVVSSVEAVAGLFEVSTGGGASMAVVSSSLPGDVPNILFNRPPWLEKLLRLLPARLKISQHA
jgi:hypothetical protein